MKDSYFILTLLILGPQTPGKDMNVFLRPLINELKDLWVLGLETRDTVDNSVFTMCAALLWLVNDFPTQNNLSGWSGRYKAYLTYNEDTPSLRVKGKNIYFGRRRFFPITQSMKQNRKFKGKVEKRPPPRRWTTEDILRQMSLLPVTLPGKHMSFGGQKQTIDRLKTFN